MHRQRREKEEKVQKCIKAQLFRQRKVQSFRLVCNDYYVVLILKASIDCNNFDRSNEMGSQRQNSLKSRNRLYLEQKKKENKES